jgi:nucleoside phosphorylase
VTLTAKALLSSGLEPDAVIVTGLCYGLNSKELDGGDQEVGDIVVSTQLRAVDHKKVTVRETVSGTRSAAVRVQSPRRGC